MSRYEVRIAGLGGQGVVLAGIILGSAFSIYAGKNATQTQSYGPEARGSACKSEIVIADEEIDYPKVEMPDLIAVMSQEAYERYVDEVKPGAVLIFDPDMVADNKSMKNVKSLPVPAMRMAERLGKKIVANIVMVGAIAAASRMIDAGSVEKAIENYVPKGTEKLNVEAFRVGYNYVRNRMESAKVGGRS